jgi:membrane fusion protein (multidrug efflux system)
MNKAVFSGESMEPATQKVNNRKRIRRLFLLLGLFGVAATLLGVYWLMVLRYRVTTEDAYVMADSARISSRVSGTVLRVMAENDHAVRRGQLLFELDPRDYQAAMHEAQGVLDRIEAEARAAAISITTTDARTEAQVRVAMASLQEAREKKQEHVYAVRELEKKRLILQADLKEAKRDFTRLDSLGKSGAVSEDRRDKADTALVKAEGQLEVIDAELAAKRASLGAADRQVDRAGAELEASQSDRSLVEIERHKHAALEGEKQEALAILETARLNLSYCKIRAPISGYIAQKSIQVGDRVQPGQAVMAVVPLQNIYVEANFKEIQLGHIRLGQPVTIKADVYPDYTYHGKVVGIRAGTGASFSLLPPENATGHWIKVVQRVPVKINLDESPPADYPLRVGFSLHVTVSTRDRSGSMLEPLSSKP